MDLQHLMAAEEEASRRRSERPARLMAAEEGASRQRLSLWNY